MKKTKILVPALGMLLLGTAASVTGTVAWFSLNTTVTANGMQIKAKSDNTYLLISKTNTTASAIQTENVKTVDAGINATIYASAPCLTAEQAALLPASTGKKVGEDPITVAGAQITNAATAAEYTNWYTAEAAAPSAATMAAGTARQLTAFTNYVVVQNFYLTVAAGANGANNLSLTSTISQYSTGNDVNAVKYLITTSDGGYAAISTANNGTPVSISGSNTTLSDSIVLTVTLYIYYDGNEEHVYTNNAAQMLGGTIALSFTVSPVAAA